MQMKKLRHREVKALSQGPLALNWKGLDLNPEFWVPEPAVLTTVLVNRGHYYSS